MRVAVLPVTVLLTLVPAAQSGTIVETVEAIDRARLAGSVAAPPGGLLSVGNLELTLSSGEIFPILVDGGVGGVFFQGDGRFEYTSVDPFEAANFRTNVKRATSFTPESGSISGTVNELVFWGPGYLEGWVDRSEGDPSQIAQKAFEKFRKKREHDQTAVEAHVAHGLHVAHDPPFAIVEMTTSGKDLFYAFETIDSRDELILALEKFNFGTRFTKQLRFPEILSRQPIGRDRLARPSLQYRLTDVEATVVNPEGMDVRAEVRETYEILAPTRFLSLTLSSWRNVEGIKHDYVLQTVHGEDGRPLHFVHREGTLIVELPETVTAGGSVVLDFVIEGDILNRPRGDSYWQLGPGGWLPEPRRVDANFHAYRVVVKAPKPFTPFSNGKTVRRWEEGDLACAEFKEDNPIFLPVILAGKYRTFEQTADGLTIQVHAYGQAKPDRMKKLANNLFALREFYAKVLGDYPFEELKVIEINELGWGQAPPGIIFITKEAFLPGGSQNARGWSMGINSRLAHELAHPWWGDISPWASDADYWLCESTAEYYAVLAMGQLWRESEFEKEYDGWRDRSRWVQDRGSILLANQLSTEDGFRDRQALLYAKGPIVLHALRREMGDNPFFTAFKTLLTNRRFQHISTQDVISVVNYVTGEDYTDWIHRYIAGTEWPELETTKTKKR